MALSIILTANYLGGSINRRIKALEGFERLIQYFKTYIAYSKTPVPRIISMLEKKEVNNCFFIALNYELQKNGDFYTSWCNSLKSVQTELFLDSEDVHLLCSFAQCLGSSDINGQLENCELYIKLISSRLDELRLQAKTKIKVYDSIGMMIAGIAVIILV